MNGDGCGWCGMNCTMHDVTFGAGVKQVRGTLNKSFVSQAICDIMDMRPYSFELGCAVIRMPTSYWNIRVIESMCSAE